MANTIKIKRSSTAGAIPTTGQLAQGELAVNLADKKLYTKDSSDTIVDLTGNVPAVAKSADYTLAKTDLGDHVSISSGDITIPPDVFAIGDVVVIYNNNGSSTRSIIRGSGVTLYWVDGADATRTLGIRGLATVICVASNTFVITGQGVS